MPRQAARLRQDNSGSGGAILGLRNADRPALLDRLSEGRLTWWPSLGVGWYPVACGIAPYDQAYFDRYAAAADTPLGRALMAARCDLVARFHDGVLLDVGIGSGAFIAARRARGLATLGHDVNPVGIAWLRSRDLALDPYQTPLAAVSLWDVLEHMPDFSRLLAQVREWLFLSLPIFADAAHVLRSKHFKPDEHCWYFTPTGLAAVMTMHGFELVATSDIETRLGREDIGTFVFRRSPPSRGQVHG